MGLMKTTFELTLAEVDLVAGGKSTRNRRVSFERSRFGNMNLVYTILVLGVVIYSISQLSYRDFLVAVKNSVVGTILPLAITIMNK